MKVDICLSKHEFKVVQEDEMKGRWWKFDQEARVERRRGGYIKRCSKGKQTYRSFQESFFVREFQQRKKIKNQEEKSLAKKRCAPPILPPLSRSDPRSRNNAAGVAIAIAPSLSSPRRLAPTARTHAAAVWRALPRGSSKTQVNKLLLLFSILRLLTRSVGRSHSSVDRISGRNKRADIGRDSFPPLIPMLISPEKKGFFAYFPAKRIYLLNELSYKVAVMPML